MPTIHRTVPNANDQGGFRFPVTGIADRTPARSEKTP
jgi:hypothetical protein